LSILDARLASDSARRFFVLLLRAGRYITLLSVDISTLAGAVIACDTLQHSQEQLTSNGLGYLSGYTACVLVAGRRLPFARNVAPYLKTNDLITLADAIHPSPLVS
jgi:hypothetical protein